MENEKKTDDVKEKLKDEDKNELNMGFFKKLWYSIVNVEKYPNMAAQGFGRAVGYLVKIVIILTIVFCLGIVYQAYGVVNEGVNYLQNSFPEFSYKDNILNVESDTPIVISAEDSVVGETIIDTKTEDENTINDYINKVTNAGGGIVILKDEIRIKNPSVAGTISYSYKDISKTTQITEFNKQDVIEFAQSSKIISLYVSIFLAIFMYVFIMQFMLTAWNAALLSIFGLFTAWVAKIKMRYVAIFNMSVYALTLSIILNILYIAINIFIPFDIEYFQVMYVTVAAIYLIAAIFILKGEFVKKQMELMKIAEAQEIIKQQLEEKLRKEEEKKEKEEQKKKDRKKEKEERKKEQENNEGEEPQGSGA